MAYLASVAHMWFDKYAINPASLTCRALPNTSLSLNTFKHGFTLVDHQESMKVYVRAPSVFSVFGVVER
tara:strand:+ start:1889 stop:2095 length:207 start_codon:yes stop_codon:yes gene_type:complete